MNAAVACPAPTPYTSTAETREAGARAAAARATGRRLAAPTTCAPGASAAEAEFLAAMQEYKRTSGRMFPTWSEVLEVLRGLGYEKPQA